MPVDKLSIEQFAQKVKAKYPEYKDVNDSSLVEKMVAKYPEYRDKINFDTPSQKTSLPKEQSQFKPMTDWLNMPQQGYQPMVPENAIPQGDHTIKTNQASRRVSEHLLDIDNSVRNLIYDHKSELTGRIKSQELGLNPKESGPLNPQAAKLESQLREDIPVGPHEIEEFKIGMNENPVMLRQGLSQKVKDLTSVDPVKANTLKGDIYRLDRQANPEKEKKVSENIDKINKGEYDYDVLNGMLTKPLGFFGSIANAFKEKGKAYDDYDVYQSGDEKKIMDRIKQRLDDDPDKAVPMPSGADGEIGAMLGGQPLKPIAGAIVAGALSGGTASAATAAAISAPEMYKLTFGSSLPHNYAALKSENPNLPDSELLQRAIELTHDQANVDALSGAAMGAIGAKAALKPSTSLLLQKSVKSALRQIGETVAIEGIGGGAIGATGQLVKNLMAQKAGIQVDESEGMAQQLVGGAFMTLGMAIAGKAGTILKPSTYTKLLHGLSKLPEETISNELARAQEVGALTPEEAQRVQTDITEQKKVDASIRGDVPESDRVKVQQKIKQRDAKEKELETAHKAYHPEIKEEIKKLDEDILALSKGAERGELQKLVDKSNPEGAAGEVLKNASEKELAAFFKDIAEQANDPATEQLTIDTFGKEIVDKAKELYPKAEPKQSSISVIKPGEIKQPETITIKPKEQGAVVIGDGVDNPISVSNELIGSDVLNADLPDDYISKSGKGVKVGKQTRYDDIYDAAQDMGIISNTTKRLFEFLKGKVKATLSNKDGGPVEGMYTPKDSHLLVYKKNANWVAIHEAIHAAIDKLGMRKEKGFTAKLRSLGDEVKEKYNANKKEFIEKYGDDFDSIIYQTIRNGNEEELITYFLTNEKFRKFANEIGIADKIHNTIPKEIRPQTQPETITIKPKPEGEASINPEAEQAASTEEVQALNPMEGGIPPDMGDLPFTPEAGDVGRLAHADTEQIYKDLGMTDRIPRATKQDITLEAEADNLIKSGYDFEGKADRVLSGRDKSFTDVEQVAFAKMVGSLNVKLQGLEVNTPEFNETFDTIERLSRASDKVGSEEAAAFRARRMFVLNDETLSAFLQKAKEANLDVPLTPEQAASVKARFDDMKASRDAYRARLEKLAAENAKLKAEGVVKKVKTESKPSAKKTHDDYVKERSDIIAQMRDKLKKSRGEASIAVVPYAKELFAIAPEVGKLVKNLVEEGIDKLEDVIKTVHAQLKDVIPDITDKDVHDIIAGEYNKTQTKTDLQEKIYEIKLQAKMINRLEALKAGIQPKSNRQKLIRSAEIEDLRKQIKELTQQREKTESEKLASLKGRYKKQIEALQKKIDTGDYKPDEKSTIALDKEAQDLKDAYVKKKIEWQKAVAQDAYNNRSQWQKNKDFVSEVLGIPRTIMASADLSAPLRQGLVLTTSHPIVASKAFLESLRQIKSPERFDRWLYDLKESRYYKDVIEKSGLYIADPNNLHLAAKEEAFRTNLAEKIPVMGSVIKGSERAYVAFLNKLRVDVFTMYAKTFAEQGMTPETRPDLYEGLGAFINAATGRGELGDLEPAAGVLNAAFFSPRLMAARINMLNPVWYAALPKEVRVMALKDMGKMIALGSTTLALAALAGAKVEINPTSTDFGKIHVGNTRWDIWGGFQQYIRAFSQVVSGYEKKGDGSIVPLGTERGQHTRAEKLLNLFRGKLAPVPSIATDVLTGKTAVGEEVELKPELKEHLIPMIYGDVKEAWKEQGPMSLLYTGLPSFLGVGTTTYEPNESASTGTSKKSGKGSKPKKPTKN